MKLRNNKQYEHVEPVNKFKKIVPKKIKLSSVKQHHTKIKDTNERKPNQINKLPSKIKDVRVILNRIVYNAVEQQRENELNFIRAYEKAKSRRMNDGLKPVDSLSLEGNVSENWRVFKRNYDIFMIAKGIDEKTDVVKINTFLNAIGKDAVEVYDTFNLTAVQRANYAQVIKAFEDFCTPRKNIVYERYKFGIRNQKEGEPFDSFLMDIKKLAHTCAFNDEGDMVRDRIVIGIADSKLRTRLLEVRNLSLDDAVDKARAFEQSKEQTESMNKAAINEIASHGTHTNQPTRQKPHGKQHNNKNKPSAHTQQNTQPSTSQSTQQQRQRNTNNGSNKTKQINNCSRCGRTHNIRECPAFGKKCNACSKLNHFSSVCKQRNVSTIDKHDDSSDYDSANELYIGVLDCPSETSGEITFPWIETVKINEQKVPSKVDTGAETDVLPFNVLKKIAPTIELRPTRVTLRAFGGQQIKPKGMCILPMSCNGISLKIKFAVVDQDFTPILGLKTCVRFGIVQPSRVFKNTQYKRKQF